MATPYDARDPKDLTVQFHDGARPPSFGSAPCGQPARPATSDARPSPTAESDLPGAPCARPAVPPRVAASATASNRSAGRCHDPACSGCSSAPMRQPDSRRTVEPGTSSRCGLGRRRAIPGHGTAAGRTLALRAGRPASTTSPFGRCPCSQARRWRGSAPPVNPSRSPRRSRNHARTSRVPDCRRLCQQRGHRQRAIRPRHAGQQLGVVVPQQRQLRR